MVLEAYNEKIIEVDERDKLITRLKKQLGKRIVRGSSSREMITSSNSPTPSTGPITMVPTTTRCPKFYTNEELEEEKAKLRVAQVDIAIKFQDKLRDTS